jgi:hypothetical protein
MDYNDTSSEAFGIFVQYAYTGSLINMDQAITLANVIEAWLLADKLLTPNFQALL